MTTPHPRYVDTTEPLNGPGAYDTPPATRPVLTVTPEDRVTAAYTAYDEARTAARSIEEGHKGVGRPRRFSPEVAEARRKAREYRTATAHNRATAALKRLHRSDYDLLLEIAKKDVAAEYGPLPGDQLPSTEG